MMSRDYWNTGDIDLIAARWKALEALNDAARKFLAHVVALASHDGDIYLDDIPEALAIRAALRAIDESERGT